MAYCRPDIGKTVFQKEENGKTVSLMAERYIPVLRGWNQGPEAFDPFSSSRTSNTDIVVSGGMISLVVLPL